MFSCPKQAQCRHHPYHAGRGLCRRPSLRPASLHVRPWLRAIRLPPASPILPPTAPHHRSSTVASSPTTTLGSCRGQALPRRRVHHHRPRPRRRRCRRDQSPKPRPRLQCPIDPTPTQANHQRPLPTTFIHRRPCPRLLRRLRLRGRTSCRLWRPPTRRRTTIRSRTC